MSTSLAMDHPLILSNGGENGNDPFLSPPTTSTHQRFSHFDKQLFALGPSASPEQAKRALEAHLAETTRRIQEASNLGTTLVQQRKDLEDRLKDVEKQHSEGDITPELRQKLIDIEKEYNEVGRETARAFLPKSRQSSGEMGGSPFADKRSASPSKFESQATSSPSKFSVPNRKQRNQPSNRVHDIEFATEISTSLLAQIRHLQGVLAEREETLKTIELEKSRLEIEAEGFVQRLRTLDESESRYKDENWNLETQIHEHLAAQKESTDREKKLTHNLNILQAEKSAAQKELDEIKLSHAKLQEQHTSAVKHHDVELGTAKRNMSVAEIERRALQRKMDELTSQNQELARAIAHQRGRTENQDESRGKSDEEFQTATDGNTPDHSPPPSPVKMTPRHSMLESETLKSSLHHAHRMIQNLKGNIHREKTEKLELKRMLQEARDDIEVARRGEPGMDSGPKRTRKPATKESKKPYRAGQLGGLRSSKSELIDDTNWEDDQGPQSPSLGSRSMGANAGAAVAAAMAASVVKSSNTRFGSSTEQSDAFETANERATETEDFQTGLEELSGEDELTETEKGGTIRPKHSRQSIALSKSGSRHSFHSTASTSDDEYMFEDAKTPNTEPQRLRLKVRRGGNRRSRVLSEETGFDTPTSYADSSTKGTPQPAGQSLFAELGELGSDDESVASGTPSRYASRNVTPQSSRPGTAKNLSASIIPPVPKIPMVDSSMMTDPWEPEPITPSTPRTPTIAVPVSTSHKGEEAPSPINTSNQTSGTVTMATVLDDNDQLVPSELQVESQTPIVPTQPVDDKATLNDEHPLPSLAQSESQAAEVALGGAALGAIASGAILAKESEALPPQSRPQMADAASQWHDDQPKEPEAAPLPPQSKPQMADAASQWHDEQVKEPAIGLLKVQAPNDGSRPVSTTYSDRSSQYDSELTDDKLAKFPSPPVSRANTPMTILAGVGTVASAAAPLTMSTIRSEQVEPTIPEESEPQLAGFPFPATPKRESKPTPLPLGFSSIQSVDTEPIDPLSPRSPKRDGVMLPSNELGNEPFGEPVDQPDDLLKSKDEPVTPKSGFMSSVFGGWNKKSTSTGAPVIAEDETRQSPSQSPVSSTPDSQKPFKMISGNAAARSPKKPRVETVDESSQTSITANQIDEMFKSRRLETILAEDGHKATGYSPPHGTNIPATLRLRKSQESVGSVGRANPRSPDTESPVSPVDAAGVRRPGSAGSGRNTSISSNYPPLPQDHKQVIAAAAQRAGSSKGSGDQRHLLPTSSQRTGYEDHKQFSPQGTERSGSSSGVVGTMLPPPLPSTYKNGALRPKTSSSQAASQAAASVRPGTALIYRQGSNEREVHSPTGTGASRHSSVSSFASEVDTRFNLRQGIPMPQGVEPSADPRMINAITQTMIGEYLWKYTRKAGRGGMSENRHRRYFWVHPYTRTLYWSDRDPSTAGRAELKAKSVSIEAVRVVTDDNPMPPGLHRKSLVIMTPGRTIKFTASTGQRHETWFNALSYLLLRTGEDAVSDTVEVSGALTNDDIDEFNPGFSRPGSTRRGPPSLSSYNSRTTRNESPISKNRRYSTLHPTLGSKASRPSIGTFSRLSNYLVPGEGARTFSGRRSRSFNVASSSIYEASEVHDSAEDLREQIEKQDRDADRLENVRACCDGKHDVGHLHTSKGRQTMSAASGSYFQTHRTQSRAASRSQTPNEAPLS